MIKKHIWLLFLFCFACETNEPLKHPLDKSQVRTLVLENELRVYLLSDPKFNVSSASVSVQVGSLDNPEDRQGLAHFLEHMLFLGTEKYPDVDEYSSYLRNNGGYSNAYTASDLTNYQFQVLPDAFEGAIDRFSQFFISPLFTEEYTAREVNAVNSEHQKNIMNDNWRRFRLSGIFAKDGHPEQKFGTGNLETLGDIDRTELIEFYDKYYSSNRMGVALLSTHSLDQMEDWARKYFSSIKNHKKEVNKYDSNYFDKKETFRLVQVDPVKDIRDLTMMFPISGTRYLYDSKPDRQFGFVLGHEGTGSLLSYLKDKGWAISLSAGASSDNNDYGGASVTVGLTEEGLDNYREVLKVTMDYVELMRRSGHPKHVFEELKTMAALDEIYASKGEGMWRATQLANEVMMFSLEDAGRTNYIYSDNSSKTYEDLLSHITPDNMLTMLIAKGVKTDTVEHFYQAPYSYLEDDSFYKELIETREYSELTIPEINPFIPKKASVPKRKLDNGVLPKKIESGNGTSLYFGQDHEFLRPKGVISLKVLFPKDKMSVEHRVRSRIYSACVRESLNELSYPAKQAGLNYSIREGYEGIFVDVNGYTESALKLYGSMLDHMTNFSITQKQFEAIKDKVVRDYENFSLSDAHIQTRELAPDLFYKYKYTWKEALPIAKGTTLEDIKQYSSSLYERTFLEAMVYGDFVKEDGKKVVSLFKNKTNTKPIAREEAFEIDYLDLSKKETIQYVEELLVNNSCFYRKYKIGEDTPENRALATLISKAIEQPFYTEMRTNQQLGYIVWSYPRSYDETYYLNLVIQSGVYPADELNKRVDKFVSGSVDIINQLDDETFQQLIDSAIEQLERKPMSISERATKHKNLIFEHGGDFDRDQKTIESLRVAKKETVAEHLRTMVSEDSRNMVNILGFAENHENTTGMTSSFSDLGEWKSTRVYK